MSALVDLAGAAEGWKRREARAEAEALARLGGTLLHGHDPCPRLVEQLRVTFGLDSVALLERDRQGWRIEAVAGHTAPIRPEYATDAVELDPQTMLALTGRRLAGDDRRVLRAFTDQLAVALESRRLTKAAADAACSLRPTSSAPLLAAVSMACAPHWRRSRPRSRACSKTTLRSRRTRPPSCWPPSTSRPTDWTGWSATCST